MNIGFLGCGKIAEPMIRSIVRRFPDATVHVSRRSRNIVARLENKYFNVSSGENQWVLDESDIVVLSVLADVAKAQFPELQFRSDHRLISVMADISLQEIAELTGDVAALCVTVPLPFIEQGGCPLPVYPDGTLVDEVFGDENQVIVQQQETHMGPHFAATAILSTVMAQLDVTSQWLGKLTGSKTDAEIYVASLVSGYMGAMPKDGQERFTQALDDLSTEGGLNRQLLIHNVDAGMLETLNTGLQALEARVCSSEQR